ncbi:hypothetical protein CK203_086518 [Vitis vinifera]|uniref:Uncharacterized protein n=1 Tax=Vitis vinifera TaxID=29760 RepID=A0A438EIF0_VITVI|nr:hypothetical protein CK203_086518 [Vitis vinifera]
MSMATDLISFRPIGIRACAASCDSHRRSTSSNWWTPLFGWSPDPDYIDPEPRRRILSRRADPSRILKRKPPDPGTLLAASRRRRPNSSGCLPHLVIVVILHLPYGRARYTETSNLEVSQCQVYHFDGEDVGLGV